MRNRLALSVLGVLLCTWTVWSQTNLGSILGAVNDQSGASVAGATVTLTDIARGSVRTLTTDSAGAYAALSLIPGSYTIRAEATGFNTVERKDVLVQVGQELRIDLAMTVGSQTQVITVTEETPLMNTSNATMGGVIENQSIQELPVSGRNYLFLLQARPGIQMTPGGSSNSYNTSGIRQSGQNYMFDGLFDSNVNTGALVVGGVNNGGGPDQANLVPLDAIQEVNVILMPKVEYGWKAGAVINVGLKSGTNSIHGTSYAFGNSDSFNARNPFLLPDQPKQSVGLEQFGAAVGGPVKKDRLFYFGTYEGQRVTVVAPQTGQAPTTAFVAGDTKNSLPAAIAGINSFNSTAGTPVPVSQLSLNMAGCANSGSTNGANISCNVANGLFGNSTNSNIIASNFPTTGGSNNVLGKVDYTLNEHNTFHGEYFWGTGSFDAQTAALLQPYFKHVTHTTSQLVRGVWAWIPNSSWVNEARFGYDRITQYVLPLDCTVGTDGAPDYTKMGFVNGVSGSGLAQSTWCGLTPISITGFTSIGYGGAGYFGSSYPQGVDSVSYTHGTHVMKFGGEFRLNSYNATNSAGLKGTLSFNNTTNAFTGATPLQNFLTGTLSAGTLLLGDPRRAIKWQSYAAFFQDDWRVTSRLTLNLGVRYELQTPIWDEVNSLLGNFDPASATGLVQQSGGPLTKYDKNNFAPRLGVAWDVGGKGKTVVRGGIGMYHVSDIAQWVFSAITPYSNPTGGTFYLANGAAVPGTGTINTGNLAVPGTTVTANWRANNATLGTAIFGNLSTTGTVTCGNGLTPTPPPVLPRNPSPCTIGAVDPNIITPVFTEWNLAVQRALTSRLTLEVAYVGNHGTDLYFMRDVNQPTPGAIVGTGAQAGQSATVLELQRRPYYNQFPYLGQIKVLNNQDRSNFHALQSTLTERAFHGLSFVAAYQYGHALDEASLDGANNPQIIRDSTRPQLEYGNSTYDIRHKLTLNFSYQVPGRKAPAQVLEGWDLNSSIIMNTGLAWDAFDASSDLSGTGEKDDRWDLFGNAKDFWGYGGLSAIPCYGITNGGFGKVSSCTAEAIPAGAVTSAAQVANMPQACITAASQVPGNSAVPGSSGLASLANFGCYMSGNSAIVPPAQGTFGTMGRNLFYGRSIRIWDLSVNKRWKITERLSTQFRTEIFNVLNTRLFNAPKPATNFSDPSSPGTFGSSPGTPDVVSGSPVIGSGSPRKIQFGLKLIF